MSELSRREKILLGLLLVAVLSFCGMAYYVFYGKQNEVTFELDKDLSIPVESSVQDEADGKKAQDILVYVVGAVKAPGVYKLNEGSRVKDAIESAGGPLFDADLFVLNLAEKLQDEDKIYIPKQGEADEVTRGKSGINISSKDNGKININTADIAELETLPGIGPATAQKIIDYRNENGRFKNIEELKNVSGIGDKKFEQIKEKITSR